MLSHHHILTHGTPRNSPKLDGWSLQVQSHQLLKDKVLIIYENKYILSGPSNLRPSALLGQHCTGDS